jgi:hypothetical protein
VEQSIDYLFKDDPAKWIQELPAYQQKLVEDLMQIGCSYEDAARAWLTASAANTFPYGTSNTVGSKDKFFENLKTEVTAFLCGGKKYKKERDGLFGEKGLARGYFVGAVSAAVAPSLGSSAAVLAPVVALVLAGLGKITLNAWCSTMSGTARDGGRE